MKYKPIALLLLLSLIVPLHGARGRKMVRKQKPQHEMERSDFLTIERARSRSRSRVRSLSRERELSIERDRERAATMGKCIQFGTVLAKIASVIAGVVLKLVIR